ncbi:hypothetical protein HanRHA438_Chr01g0027411 [Helianthus annuus]|nr:hypothetical protein HanRHA438_Chr01g0027411 [Helianthus annuus]
MARMYDVEEPVQKGVDQAEPADSLNRFFDYQQLHLSTLRFLYVHHVLHHHRLHIHHHHHHHDHDYLERLKGSPLRPCRTLNSY